MTAGERADRSRAGPRTHWRKAQIDRGGGV